MKYLALSAMWMLALSASAFDYSEADALFDARSPTLEGVAQAKKLYVSAVKQTKGDERVHAAERYAQLAFYEGALVLEKGNEDKQTKIFGNCQKVVETISPRNLGEKHPAYYYWKSTCLGMYLRSIDQMDAINYIGDFKNLIVAGLKLRESRTYENGGMFRVASAAYMANEMLAMFGLYDLRKALQYADAAMKLGPQVAGGKLLKAKVLHKLNRDSQADGILEDLVQELEAAVENNSLDPKSGPEDLFVLKMAKEMLAGTFEE